jgi:hypothetical protein
MGYGAKTCLDSPAKKKDLHKAAGLYPCHNQGGNQVGRAACNREMSPVSECACYTRVSVTYREWRSIHFHYFTLYSVLERPSL